MNPARNRKLVAVGLFIVALIVPVYMLVVEMIKPINEQKYSDFAAHCAVFFLLAVIPMFALLFCSVTVAKLSSLSACVLIALNVYMLKMAFKGKLTLGSSVLFVQSLCLIAYILVLFIKGDTLFADVKTDLQSRGDRVNNL